MNVQRTVKVLIMWIKTISIFIKKKKIECEYLKYFFLFCLDTCTILKDISVADKHAKVWVTTILIQSLYVQSFRYGHWRSRLFDMNINNYKVPFK